MIELLITGLEVVPYVRMTQRGKWVRPEALRYRANQETWRGHYADQMIYLDLEPLPERTPLRFDIDLTIPRGLHYCDLDNLYKALADAANGILFPDDRWIDAHRAVRRQGTGWGVLVRAARLED